MHSSYIYIDRCAAPWSSVAQLLGISRLHAGCTFTRRIVDSDNEQIFRSWVSMILLSFQFNGYFTAQFLQENCK